MEPEITKEAETFLDDCVGLLEALRCLQDKGVEAVDDDGATLSEKAFDKCFPGLVWSRPEHGTMSKRAVYRGFLFETFKLEEEIEK